MAAVRRMLDGGFAPTPHYWATFPFFVRKATATMCRTIGLLLGATVLLMGLVSTASAQPKGRGRRGGNDSLPTLAGYEAVQKELGISGDLAEKLVALREDMLAARQKEEQIAGIGPQDFQSMSDETRQENGAINSKLNDELNPPRLKELISAGQIKRLSQIRLAVGVGDSRAAGHHGSGGPQQNWA